MDTSKYTFIDLGLPSGLLWSMTAIDHTDHPDAIAKYGKDMPTWDQAIELMQHTRATAIRTVKDNKDGVLYTGANGNSIFVPLYERDRIPYFETDKSTLFWTKDNALNENRKPIEPYDACNDAIAEGYEYDDINLGPQGDAFHKALTFNILLVKQP